MLTVVSEREGIPLAVVRGGRPAKGDTIWLGQAPYCVTSIDRDVVMVRPGAWSSPHCATGTQMRKRSLYAVNPGPADFAGYRGRPNPPIDLPQYSQGPAFFPEFAGQPPMPQQQRPFLPHVAPQPTYEGGFFGQPHVLRAYHFQFRFPIFDLSTYRPPQRGERVAFDGVEYEYTQVTDKHLLVRPTIPWIGFIIAEDKRTGDGLAWVPITNMSQVSGAKQWLKKKLQNEQGLSRAAFHLYRKTGHQLTRYFRNNPNAKVPVYRGV